MINILSSDAESQSNDFKEVDRERGQNNLEWLSNKIKTKRDQAVLVMVGGRSEIDFRLRIAQAHVRRDLQPSKWSHVMLLKNPAEKEQSKIYEIALDPMNGFGFPTLDNGVQEGELRRYSNPKTYPNIAVLTVPVSLKEIEKGLYMFKKQRAVLDGVDLIVRWLAFVWGVGRSGNPLLDGFGIPSAAMLEIVVGAAGFDLTPGLESRSSCPEMISQSAKYWHKHYEEQDKPILRGFYTSPHHIQ